MIGLRSRVAALRDRVRARRPKRDRAADVAWLTEWFELLDGYVPLMVGVGIGCMFGFLFGQAVGTLQGRDEGRCDAVREGQQLEDVCVSDQPG